MEGLGAEVGVIAAVLLLAQTVIAAFFASRNKHLSARSKRLSRLEPAHLDLLDWAFQVRTKAAARGWNLPQLPPSVASYYLEEGEEEMVVEDEMKRLQAVRRHEEQHPPSA